MSLLVTGTVGIDTVITPCARAEDVLGGSAAYFALAASVLTPVRLVAVVGEDFPAAYRDALSIDRIDLSGLEVRAGSKTFRWAARYMENMNERQSLRTDLNVIAEAPPVIPNAFKDSRLLFLANTHPAIQLAFRAQLPDAALVVCDTMDLWIENARDALRKTLAAVDGIIINDGEAIQLTGKQNAVTAGREILKLGPKFAVVKKGEHGAILITPDLLAAIPAYPSERVIDPTGAGDSFAGGMLGYLATQETIDAAALRRAIVRGTVVASFTIEDFSVNRLRTLTREELDGRVDEFTHMLRFD